MHVVADDPVREVERQADVVEALRGERALACGERDGEAGRLALRVEPLAQVETAEIEGKLDPKHAEEALDVVGRLRDRVCYGLIPFPRISSSALKPFSSRAGIVKL